MSDHTQPTRPGWPEWFSYDPAANTVTLFGICYATEFFKTFGVQPAGYTFKIVERQNGTVTVQQERNELEAAAPALLAAAKLVIAGLNARIDAAPKSAVPVFDGIADLNDAIWQAEHRA